MIDVLSDCFTTYSTWCSLSLDTPHYVYMSFKQRYGMCVFYGKYIFILKYQSANKAELLSTILYGLSFYPETHTDCWHREYWKALTEKERSTMSWCLLAHMHYVLIGNCMNCILKWLHFQVKPSLEPFSDSWQFFLISNQLLLDSLIERNAWASVFSMLQMKSADWEVEHFPYDWVSVVEPKVNNPPASISACLCCLTSPPVVLGSQLHQPFRCPYQPVRRSQINVWARDKGKTVLLCYRWHGCRDRGRKGKQQGNSWFSCGYAVV